ncbi:hypothetical protein FQR65_LT15729 [Abscondita terminalis]|nr:hypothetical protein FQR65_LT15729 [Abscondita terminalis]
MSCSEEQGITQGICSVLWSNGGVNDIQIHFNNEHIDLESENENTNYVVEGNNFTGAECDLKFWNLKKTYKRIKDNHNSSGRGTIIWLYFDTFDAIFGNDADVNAAFIVSSMTEGEPKLSSVPSSRKHVSTVATSSSRCTPAEVERASSSCTETASDSNVEDTSRFSKLPKKRKTTTSAEHTEKWVFCVN